MPQRLSNLKFNLIYYDETANTVTGEKAAPKCSAVCIG